MGGDALLLGFLRSRMIALVIVISIFVGGEVGGELRRTFNARMKNHDPRNKIKSIDGQRNGQYQHCRAAAAAEDDNDTQEGDSGCGGGEEAPGCLFLREGLNGMDHCRHPKAREDQEDDAADVTEQQEETEEKIYVAKV